MTASHNPVASGGDPAQELATLLGFLKHDPANRSLRGEVFDLALAIGRWDIAGEQTRAMLSASPVDFAWRHRLALLDMAQQQWDSAALVLQSLVDEGQRDPALTHNLAYVEFARGRCEAALACLAAAPGGLAATSATLALALRCEHRLGHITEGLQLFEQYGAAVGDAQVAGIASLLAADAERLPLARQLAQAALAADGRQQEALVAMATVLLAERDAKGALHLLAAALDRNPHDGRSHSAAGLAHLLELDFTAARTEFHAALTTMAQHIGTWHGLGWCEIASRDLGAAETAFRKALDLDRNFAESHGGLAVVLAYQGQAEEAQRVADLALKLDRACLSARFAHSLLAGDTSNAESFARMARRILGDRTDATGRSIADVILQRKTGGDNEQ